MLKEMKLDLVEVHMKLPQTHWTLLASLLMDTAEYHGVKTKTVHKAPLYGHYLSLVLDGQRLEVGIYRQYTTRWIMYRFKGCIDVVMFEDALVLMGEASLAHVLVNGTVKTLELAMDIPGHLTNDYLFYQRGVRHSHVVANAANNGFSHYLGSRRSRLQLIAYDKAQQIRDAGGKPPFKDVLRIEARVKNFKGSMLTLRAKLEKWNPFDRFMAVEKSVAVQHKTVLDSWGFFVSACGTVGTPAALSQFKWQKKSLISHISSLRKKTMTPSLGQFQGSLESILPKAALKKTIGQLNFQHLYEKSKPAKKQSVVVQ